jgi:hypothetical protein
MTYNDVIKKLESIGIAIDYSTISVNDLNSECDDIEAFEAQLRKDKK